MPDFRGNLDQAKFDPRFVGQSTTGPNAMGEQQTWQNRPGLEESSAQQLARLLGADLSALTYNGGPYSQERPQYQLDFGSGNKHDAAMLASNYQNAPDFYNASLAAELASDRAKPVAMQEMEARAAAGQGARMLPPTPSIQVPAHPTHPAPTPQQPPPVSPPPTLPGAPIRPGEPTAPPTTVPGPKWPDSPSPNIPGQTWPTPTAPNKPGPIWTLPALPAPPTRPGVVQVSPGAPGGYTAPPAYTGSFPLPIQLLMQQQQQQAEQEAARRAGLLGSTYRSGGLLGGAY